MRHLLPLWLCCASFAAGPIPNRYIVELSEDPVAEHVIRRGIPGGLQSEAAIEHRARVQTQQRQVREGAEQEGAEVLDTVETVANALLVRMPESQAGRLAALPGVKSVRPVRTFHLMLDHALPMHRVPDAWSHVGHDRAGAGMKIAVIDTGIDSAHPGFQDDSLPIPAGYPKVNADSDKAFTNHKVIVARSYASYFDRPERDKSARDRVGHGTAVAMAAAGVLVSAPLADISGVAPKAYLGSYKVFGSPGINDGAPEDAILKAIDDAVADGMDVINLSLGSDAAPAPQDDVGVKAIERASKLGVLVVVSAGNNGPDPNTIGSPATAPSAIAVGASVNDRVFSSMVSAGKGGSFMALPAGGGSKPPDSLTAPLTDVASLDKDGMACSALPDKSLTGAIALILRGVCYFEDKITNVQKAGAVAALVYSDKDRPDPVNMVVGSATLPALMIAYDSGIALKQQLATTKKIQATLRFALGPVTRPADRLADFSSNGPSVDGAIKPELVAVGTDFYTATEKFDKKGELYSATGYVSEQGTSFSAPLVAGAAALLKSAHPGLSTAQYRSLLINTAAPISGSRVRGKRVAATLQQAGVGLLDVSAALRATTASVPAALSFGVGGPDLHVSRHLTISNVGTQADTFSVLVVSRDAGPAPAVSTNAVQLAPGASTDVVVSFSGTAMNAGDYQGVVKIQGTRTGSPTKVPYWYGIALNTPSHVTILDTRLKLKAGESYDNAIVFRVTDSSGIALPKLKPKVTVVSGGGTVQVVAQRDFNSPGSFAVDVKLGLKPGSNLFQIQAGGITNQVELIGE